VFQVFSRRFNHEEVAATSVDLWIHLIAFNSIILIYLLIWNACTGCGVLCVIVRAENNVPAIGKAGSKKKS
jgi:hypothetical protein